MVVAKKKNRVMRYSETSHSGELIPSPEVMETVQAQSMKRASQGGTGTARDAKSKEGRNIPVFIIFCPLVFCRCLLLVISSLKLVSG